MKNRYQTALPESVAAHLGDGDCYADGIGRSDSSVLVYSDRVLKIEKTSALSDGEYAMLLWLEGKLPAPRVIAFERENGFNYLLMTKLSGRMACDCGYSEETVSRLLAEGLKMLWKTDISDCPRRFGLENRLAEAKGRLTDGSLRGRKPADGAFPDFETLYTYLEAHKPMEEPVFSHGDYCLPNVFLSEEGVCGFLDLGRAGVSDVPLVHAI